MKPTFLETESHLQAMEAHIECMHMRDHPVRGACVDCMAVLMHNLALDFARLVARQLHTVASNEGPRFLSSNQEDIDRQIEQAVDMALGSE